MRYALIRNSNEQEVAAYLPSNYKVLGTEGDDVLIGGQDNAGWTLDDYVLPRLASGLRFGQELSEAEGEAWAERLEWMAEARYLGADAALAAASWLSMGTEDAQSILDDVDPEVMDRYPEPNLSGEWADDPTPASLAREVTGYGFEELAGLSFDVTAALADEWEAGRDAVWGDALQAHALRTLGRVAEAKALEDEVEGRVTQLRGRAHGTVS